MLLNIMIGQSCLAFVQWQISLAFFPIRDKSIDLITLNLSHQPAPVRIVTIRGRSSALGNIAPAHEQLSADSMLKLAGDASG